MLLIAIIGVGGRIRRCDARCYDAHETECDCICAGVNHGVGLDQAIENTRRRGEAWIARARHRHPKARIVVNLEAATDALF
ncbi:hypothetical protein ACQP10_37960 (plasmid) [Streptosporangium sandarakinum]|uniref:hypothetical protein n=1 Tax=Streptosporangium sandarakinum TaxID=1260955 RepID=UPI003D8EF0AD